MGQVPRNFLHLSIHKSIKVIRQPYQYILFKSFPDRSHLVVVYDLKSLFLSFFMTIMPNSSFLFYDQYVIIDSDLPQSYLLKNMTALNFIVYQLFS